MAKVRSSNPTAKRNPEDREADFVYTCDCLKDGMSFYEITQDINKMRDYSVTVAAIYNSYTRRINQAVRHRTAQEEVDRLLAELDWIQTQAANSWGLSIGLDTSKIKKGWGKDGKIAKEYLIMSERQGKGDAKYLTIMLSCQERRAKLLGLDEKEAAEIKLLQLLEKSGINDEAGGHMSDPVHNEEEMRDKYGEEESN